MDGFQYGDAILQYFPTAEGYVDVTRKKTNGYSAYNYVYQFKDHLGNIRMNYAWDPADNLLKIKEESHYYPFGLKHSNYNGEYLQFQEEESEEESIVALNVFPPSPLPTFYKAEYNYKYNGQELQDELGLNMTAMDYRLYDNALGRFMNIDPLADIDGQIDISPYSFAWNNPVVFNDPSGLCPECNTNVNNPTEGQDYTDSNGLSWIYNGTDWVGQLNEVVINNVPEESTTEKVVDVATDFIPVVGSVKDIYKGARDGDGLQFAMGVGFLIFDVASLGSGSLLKGGIKTLGKELLEEGAEQGLKKTSRIFEVGAYKELKGVEKGLEAHHVGQKKIMSNFIADYNYMDAPSILVPKLGHTSGKGVLSRSISGFNNARQVLARDIYELRRVYPNVPNSSLEELIQMNKSMYPGAFIKP